MGNIKDLISKDTTKLILILIIHNMEIRKISRGDRLQPALLELNVGESIKVPYRYFSENSLRSTASQLKVSSGVEFEINARSTSAAIATRVK